MKGRSNTTRVQAIRVNRFILMVLLLFILISSVQAEARHALVIGNGNYEHTTPLRNPVNDAADVARALEHIGFSTTVVLDANVMEMEDAVLAFTEDLRSTLGSAGIFYYAGHAVQSGGVNYLLPIDADIRSESELRRKTISTQEILEQLSDVRNGFNMVVLDACRDNPFAGSFRTTQRGLAVTTSAPPETLVVYATEAGGVASDGDGDGRNSPFTSAFLKHVGTAGVDVEIMIRDVMGEVQRSTEQKQRPWKYSSLTTSFQLVPRATTATGKTIVQVPVVVDITKDYSIPMAFIEGGTFQMGSTSGDPDESPVHSVMMSSFSMGTYEVTQDIYEQVMGSNPSKRKGRRLPVEWFTWVDAVEFANALSRRDGFEEVYTINGETVSCDWNKRGYRLPTEAEWEYAAKGGKLSKGYSYAGSDTLDDVAWCADNSSRKTHDVGGKRANELGLYDMNGNVWEWCWDWYGEYPVSGQTNPTGPASAGSYRVIRGGGFCYHAPYVRPSNRTISFPAFRSNDYGFRLVLPIGDSTPVVQPKTPLQSTAARQNAELFI